MLSRRHARGIQNAIDAAECSTLRTRVGAAVWRDSDLVGWNQAKTHPAIEKLGYPAGSTLHAELDLIVGLGFYGLRGETVYVARLLRNGKTALARPCPVCMAALVRCQVKRVVWTTDEEGKLGEIVL